MFNLRLFQLQELGLILPNENCCFMIEQLGATSTDGDLVPDRIEVHETFSNFMTIESDSTVKGMKVSFISVDTSTKELEIWLDW